MDVQAVGKGSGRPGHRRVFSLRRQKRTAYHEAGHVVAAVAACWVSPLSGRVCHFRIGGVSIRPDSRTRGRHHYRPRPYTGTVAQLAEIDAMISWAGYYAEKRIFPSLHWFNIAEGDYQDFWRYAALSRGPRGDDNREAHRRFERISRKRAKEMVRDAWPAIEALAKKLIEKEALSGREARAVVSRVLRGSL